MMPLSMRQIFVSLQDKKIWRYCKKCPLFVTQNARFKQKLCDVGKHFVVDQPSRLARALKIFTRNQNLYRGANQLWSRQHSRRLRNQDFSGICWIFGRLFIATLCRLHERVCGVGVGNQPSPITNQESRVLVLNAVISI